MSPPPIHLFLTTIASQPALRQRQEYLLRVLQVKKIPFSSYDLASDEEAKKLWRRKAPLDKQQLPGILIGGRFPGTFSDFEEAVECGDLDAFLRQNEDYKESEFERPAPEVKPIGVPGAYSPSQMHPKYTPTPSPAPSPLKAKTKGRVASKTGDQLSAFGLHDLDVTDEDLAALVQELGFAVKDAKDLVKGLGNDTKSAQDKEIVVKLEPKDDEKAAADVTKETEAKTEGEVEQKEGVQKDSDIAPEPAKAENGANSDEQPTKTD